MLDELVSVATYMAELLTLQITCYYSCIQTVSNPGRNGFCLVDLHTHQRCALYDAIFFVCMFAWIVLLPCGAKLSMHTAALLGVLSLHMLGHSYLYRETTSMTLAEANEYRHWSFTWVLLLVNIGYCIPRILMYPPLDTDKRVHGGAVVSSIGILVLAAVAMFELIACDLMSALGGHLFYDWVISAVVMLHLCETTVQSNGKPVSLETIPTEYFEVLK